VGLLTYRDVIDPDTPHSVSFCQSILATQAKAGPIIFSLVPLRGDCNISK
jgi:hypothetical protein